MTSILQNIKPNTRYCISVNGQKAVNLGYKLQGNKCYTGLVINNERVAQIEVVVDWEGEYNGRPNKWIDFGYIDSENVETVFNWLIDNGFSGCFAIIAEETNDGQRKGEASFTIPTKRKEEKKMKNTGNTTPKALLTTAGKNTFKYLHDNYGFNFEKPFILNSGNGSFTINKVWSIIPHQLYDYDYTVVVIVKGNYSDGYNVVKLTSDNIIVELPNKHNYDYHTRPDYYNMKKSFDIDRKAGKGYYIIAQNKNYILPVQKEENPAFEENHRYIIIAKNNSYMYFKDPEKQGKKEYYSSGRFVYDRRNNNFESWFDKSGYLVIRQQERLQQQAKKIRTERQKAKYLETDNTSYIEKVRYEFNKLKTYAIGLIAAANNYETLNRISRYFDWKISWILFDIELFEQRTNNKEYSSIENSMKAYNNILVKIQKAYEELNGKDEKQ